jgi:hypothetical protein
MVFAEWALWVDRLASLDPIDYWVGMGVWVALACAAAARMAHRKQRTVTTWAFLALIFPPSLLVLACLPTVPRAGSVGALGVCGACGGALSIEATACPHCGNPQRQRSSHGWAGGLLEFAGTAAVVLAIPIAAADLYLLSQTSRRLPKCDSILARMDVNRALANVPFMRSRGISVVLLEAVKTEDADSKSTRCSAHATLSNAEKVQLDYSFTKRNDGSYFIGAQIGD